MHGSHACLPFVRTIIVLLMQEWGVRLRLTWLSVGRSRAGAALAGDGGARREHGREGAKSSATNRLM